MTTVDHIPHPDFRNRLHADCEVIWTSLKRCQCAVRDPNFFSFDSAMIDQLIKFGGVGVINTALTFITIVLLKAVVGTGDLVANAIGYAVGLCASFLFNSRWTFREEAGDKSRTATVVARFLAVFSVAYVINVATVFSLINSGANSYVAHALGMPLYTLAFFFGCRGYVFHSRP